MSRSRSNYRLIDLLMIVAFCGMVAAFLRSLWSLGRGGPSGTFLWNFLAYEAAFISWFSAWGMMRSARRLQPCPECGTRFDPRQVKVNRKDRSAPVVCSACRRRSLTPARKRRETMGSVLIASCILVIIFAVISGLWLKASRPPSQPWAVIVPLLTGVVVTAGLFTLTVFVVVALNLIRSRRLRDEEHAFAWARKCAGTQGTVTRIEPLAIWCSGPTDPIPNLLHQHDISLSRLADRLGRPIESAPPLRILCFDRRSAFTAYHRQSLADLWNIDGLYAPGPYRTMTLTTEAPPYRLFERDRTIRTLFAFYGQEAVFGTLPPFWLQQGLALSSAADVDDQPRLNRKMLVALARGQELGPEECMLIPTRTLLKWLRKSEELPNFAKFQQASSQAWSLVEYLGGDSTTEERRQAFRAYLDDPELHSKQVAEAVFSRHFGFGFGSLFDLWHEWVRAQGPGEFAPTPAEVRTSLEDRLLPLIRDPSARYMDRIQAIRDMGRAGYTLGADLLIEFLRDPKDTVPKEEIVWALEAISGHAWGNDSDRWLGWWEEIGGGTESRLRGESEAIPSS